MVFMADAMPQIAQRTVGWAWFGGGAMEMARLGNEEVCHAFVLMVDVKFFRARSRSA